jgi:NAD(P)-dependent dehydrogenase (short-subunit alcohol dehydrogenase family)
MDLSNKVALITGASRGIGRAIAEQFASCGAHVAVHYHTNHNAAQQTLSSFRHISVQADLANHDSARKLVDTVVRDMGKIDILINNAGIFELHPIPNISYEEWMAAWNRTLGTNLLGPANISFCTIQYMMKQGGGRIVNISSRGAFRGEPEAPAYGASKAGLNAMGQSMARALAPYNIFVFTVAPGFVETDMVADSLSGPEGDAIRKQSPLGRAARPEEIARTVLFLASDAPEYLTGCIVDANGASYLRS